MVRCGHDGAFCKTERTTSQAYLLPALTHIEVQAGLRWDPALQRPEARCAHAWSCIHGRPALVPLLLISRTHLREAPNGLMKEPLQHGVAAPIAGTPVCFGHALEPVVCFQAGTLDCLHGHLSGMRAGLGHDYVLKLSLNLNELQSVIFCTVQPQQCHDFMSVKNQSKTPERQTITSINVQMFAAP